MIFRNPAIASPSPTHTNRECLAGALSILYMNKKIIIENFFNDFGIKPEKENARSWIFNCPVCGGKQKLYIEKSKNRSICFRQKDENCPKTNTPIIQVLSLIADVNISKIKEWIELNNPDNITAIPFNELFSPIGYIEDDLLLQLNDKKNNFRGEDEKLEINNLTPIQIPDDFVKLNSILSTKGKEYLISRGLNIDFLQKYDIRYSVTRHRVIFPVIHNGQWVGYQGRTIYKNVEPRMYNLPGTWKSSSLMFYDNLKNADYVVIAEGAVSALKFEFVGNFVALMGKIMSSTQLQLLVNNNITQYYLALDPDAYVEMENIRNFIIKYKPNARIKFLPVPNDKEDFGDCSYNEVLEIFNAKSIDITNDTMQLYEYVLVRGQ